MHLLTLLIFGIVLLCKANALKCYECTPGPSGQCQDAETSCPAPGFECGAMRISAYAGGAKVSNIAMKSCVPSNQCVQGSVNFGIARTVVNSKCCNTDLCNRQHAPEPTKTNPNGHKCYSCDSTKCTSTVNCEGDEDRCISVSVDAGTTKAVMKGCASKLLCTENAKISGAIGGDFSCCEGNYCNSASSTGASLLLLLVPLVSLLVSC